MNELQMSFYTTNNLSDYDVWEKFISFMEKNFEAKISHIDSADPPRRKSLCADDAASYISSSIRLGKISRFFGKFGKSKIFIQISAFQPIDSFPNEVSIFFPLSAVSTAESQKGIVRSFEEGVSSFKPFYAICDHIMKIHAKRKPSGLSVDLREELLGVFWITYFDSNYVRFIGDDRFSGIKHGGKVLGGGFMILIDDFNAAASFGSSIEMLLGKDHFVDTASYYEKQPGVHAIDYTVDPLSRGDGS